MNVQLENFAESEVCSITSDSWFDFGVEYGDKTANIAKERLGILTSTLNPQDTTVLNRASDYYDSLTYLASSSLYTHNGINWFLVYKDILNGFSKGAALELLECVKLQILDTLLCQTLIVKHQEPNRVHFLHTEENFSHSQERYDYAVVNAKIQTSSYSFFGYPGLIFGGPAFGVNHNTKTWVAVDSLYANTTKDIPQRCIWANALAAIGFLIGDIDEIKHMFQKLEKSQVYILNGYALHCVQKKGSEGIVQSFEFGGSSYAVIPPDSTPSRAFVAQPNYPRSEKLQTIDSLVPSSNASFPDEDTSFTSIEMRRRMARLTQWAALIPSNLSRTEYREYLSAVCHYSPGDPYEDGEKSETGFITDVLVAFIFGIMEADFDEVVIGKNAPPVPESSALSLLAKSQSTKILPSQSLDTLI